MEIFVKKLFIKFIKFDKVITLKRVALNYIMTWTIVTKPKTSDFPRVRAGYP